MSVPVDGPPAPVTSEVCCFCGQGIGPSHSEHIRLGARWREDGRDCEQSWRAHRSCLLERLHDGVQGEGPFFGDA
jgi:hypothetical protein